LATPFFNFFALFSRFGLFTSFLRGTRLSFDVMDTTVYFSAFSPYIM